MTANLCQSCAAELSREAQGAALVFAVPMGVTNLITNLLGGAEPVAEKRSSEVGDAMCPVCGTTASDYRESGLLGCAGCYEVFAPLIFGQEEDGQRERPVHVGKFPSRGPEGAAARREVLRLQRMLRELVEAERFEEAAGVRDRLAELGEVPRSL